MAAVGEEQGPDQTAQGKARRQVAEARLVAVVDVPGDVGQQTERERICGEIHEEGETHRGEQERHAAHEKARQEWLAEQYETMHEAAEFLEGVPLLEEILSARPDPASHVSVNAFMATLSEPKRLALTSDPTFHNDPPEDAIQAAEDALADVCAKALYRRDAAIKARLSQPGLDRGEVTFGTLAGKARLSDKVPVDADFMPGYEPGTRMPGSDFYSDFTRVSFHFWYRGTARASERGRSCWSS